MNEDFNKYIEGFKLLPLNEKQKIVEDQSKQLLGFIEKLKNDLNIKDELIFNKEILNTSTSDDFAEAMLVYITMIQESFAKYVDYISNIIYKEEE